MFQGIKNLLDRITFYNEQAKKYFDIFQRVVSWLTSSIGALLNILEDITPKDSKAEQQTKE